MSTIKDLLKEENPIDTSRPALQLQFSYPHAFTTIAQAFLTKYNYEPRTQLTTFTGVTQIDEDRFMFYRRVDTVASTDLTYERVVYDRRNGGSITNELIKERPGNQERLFERGTIEPQGDDRAIHRHFVFEHQGIKTWKVEMFKKGVEKVLKAAKFNQFEQQ
jgi:hypothetical protein